MGEAVISVSSFETAVKHKAQMSRLKREPLELSPNINGIICRYLLQLFIKGGGGGAVAGGVGSNRAASRSFELQSVSNETIALFWGFSS